MRAYSRALVVVSILIVILLVLGAHWVGYFNGSTDQRMADQDSPQVVQGLIDTLPLGSSHDQVAGFLLGARAKPTESGGTIFASFPPYGGSFVCSPESVVVRFTFRTDRRTRKQVLAAKAIEPEPYPYGASCS